MTQTDRNLVPIFLVDPDDDMIQEYDCTFCGNRHCHEEDLRSYGYDVVDQSKLPPVPLLDDMPISVIDWMAGRIPADPMTRFMMAYAFYSWRIQWHIRNRDCG